MWRVEDLDAASVNAPIIEGFEPSADLTANELDSPSDASLTALPGDFNGDGCVDFSDANLLIVSIGLPVPPANPAFDFDGDRRITFNDYILWSSLVGLGCS